MRTFGNAIVVLLLLSSVVWAGGSNYGLTPGTRPAPTGKITEWPVPTPRFARDPAPGADDNIYGKGKLVHIDPVANKVIKEYEHRQGPRPVPMPLTSTGAVLYGSTRFRPTPSSALSRARVSCVSTRSVERCRHSEDDGGCPGPALAHGEPQRMTGRHRAAMEVRLAGKAVVGTGGSK